MPRYPRICQGRAIQGVQLSLVRVASESTLQSKTYDYSFILMEHLYKTDELDKYLGANET